MAASYGSIPVGSGPERSGDTDERTPLVASFFASNSPPVDKDEDRSLWSRLTFQWFTTILHKGNEANRLEREDLKQIPLPNDCSSDPVLQRFDDYWDMELERDHPSLVRALARAFGKEYLLAACLKLIHDLNLFVGPQVLHAMIDFLRDDQAPLARGLWLTLAVTISQILMSFCLRHYFFKCYQTGLRIRTAIVLAVYRKALKLSASERQTRTLGEITNLISIDASRLQDLMNYMNSLWSSPLQIALSLFFLWGELGASSLGGVAVILGMTPVTKWIAQYMGRLQKILMKAKDKRIELNSEVLSGIKVIKLQAWEEPFQKRILGLREMELKQLLKYYIVSAVSTMLFTLTPMAVATASFAAYVWSGHRLDVAEALTALTLFDILRFPLSMLPRSKWLHLSCVYLLLLFPTRFFVCLPLFTVVNSVAEAAVSVKRIRSFLLCQEHTPILPNRLQHSGIHLESVSAAYDSKKPKIPEGDKELMDKDWEIQLLKAQLHFAEQRIQELKGDEPDAAVENLLALKRLDFELKPGELVAVVGGVGCGKSSFLNAILGEVRALSGTTSVRGKLAYFSQNPFM